MRVTRVSMKELAQTCLIGSPVIALLALKEISVKLVSNAMQCNIMSA